jgi:sulfiredoxin
LAQVICSNQDQFQKQNELQLEVIMTMIYLEPQNTSHQQNSFMIIQEIPLNQIRRPLPRQNDPDKVKALMESIAAIGQKEPIDVLEVDGQYYGFSGCHRYEACQRLGKETIIARVRKAPKSVLKMHLA